MFENPGKKIKKISTILFYITVCVSMFLAISLGIEADTSYWGYTEIEYKAVPLLIFLVVVPAYSYISTLFFVGFGELLENVKKISEKDKYSEEAKETV